MTKETMYSWRLEKASFLQDEKTSTAFNFSFDVMYGAYGAPIVGGNEKLVIFGLPRSGNTWLQTMLSTILKLPVIDPWHDKASQGVGMCHRPLTQEVFLRRDFVHAVCLVRDIRDIAASYFTFVNTNNWLKKSPWFTTKDLHSFFYDFFFPRMDTLYDLENYWDKYTAFNIPIVRYENMVRDTHLVLKDLSAQLGFDFKSPDIQEAIAKTELTKLKKEGVMGYEYVSGSHFGKGVIGSYREILPPDLIKEIERRYGETLIKWGYM